jgi:hypothetical protein
VKVWLTQDRDITLVAGPIATTKDAVERGLAAVRLPEDEAAEDVSPEEQAAALELRLEEIPPSRTGLDDQ